MILIVVFERYRAPSARASAAARWRARRFPDSKPPFRRAREDVLARGSRAPASFPAAVWWNDRLAFRKCPDLERRVRPIRARDHRRAGEPYGCRALGTRPRGSRAA